MISGIYKIENKINGKFYIGSSKNIEKRFKVHKRGLNSNKHHNIYLQRSWLKYGASAFLFTIIEETNNLFEKEEFWITTLKPEYNIGSVGGGDNFTNHPNKEDLRERLSEILRTCRKPTPRLGEDNPNWKGGVSKSYCECGKEKAKPAKTCINCRDKSGDNNPFYGKNHSKETRLKLRESKLGKPNLKDRKVLVADGVTYESATEAAKSLNVSNATITYRVKSSKYDYKYLTT